MGKTKLALFATPALAILIAGLCFAGPVVPVPPANPINNSNLPQDAQINIGTAAVRGTLTASTVTAQNLNVPNINAGVISGSAAGLTNLNAAQLTTGIVPNAAINGAYSHISGLGTVATGVWQASNVSTQYGGSGQNWAAVGQGSLPFFSGTGAMSTLPASSAGQILQTNGGAGNPSWTNAPMVTGINITNLQPGNLVSGTLPTAVSVQDGSLSTVTGSKVMGNITGSAGNITGVAAIANGGTGAATAAAARTALSVPSILGSGASGTWGIDVTGNSAGATNILNGATHQIPFQAAPGDTNFFGPSSPNQLPFYDGTNLVFTNSPTIVGTNLTQVLPGSINPGNLGPSVVPTNTVGGSLRGALPNPSLSNTGVVAGTYGDSLTIPVVTVSTEGRLLSVSTAGAIADAFSGNSPVIVTTVPGHVNIGLDSSSATLQGNAFNVANRLVKLGALTEMNLPITAANLQALNISPVISSVTNHIDQGNFRQLVFPQPTSVDGQDDFFFTSLSSSIAPILRLYAAHVTTTTAVPPAVGVIMYPCDQNDAACRFFGDEAFIVDRYRNPTLAEMRFVQFSADPARNTIYNFFNNAGVVLSMDVNATTNGQPVVMDSSINGYPANNALTVNNGKIWVRGVDSNTIALRVDNGLVLLQGVDPFGNTLSVSGGSAVFNSTISVNGSGEVNFFNQNGNGTSFESYGTGLFHSGLQTNGSVPPQLFAVDGSGIGLYVNAGAVNAGGQDSGGTSLYVNPGQAHFQGSDPFGNSLTSDHQALFHSTAQLDGSGVLALGNSNGKGISLEVDAGQLYADGPGTQAKIFGAGVRDAILDLDASVGHDLDIRQRASDGAWVINDTGAGTQPLVVKTASPSNSVVVSATGVGINKSVPAATLDVAGNILSNSSVTASGFFGDGSGLTNIASTDPTRVSKAGDTMTGALTLTGASAFIKTSSSVTANAFFGNGAGLSNVSGTDSNRVSRAGDTMTGGLTLNTAASFINTTSSITANGFFSNTASITNNATIGGQLGVNGAAATSAEISVLIPSLAVADMIAGGPNGDRFARLNVDANNRIFTITANGSTPATMRLNTGGTNQDIVISASNGGVGINMPINQAIGAGLDVNANAQFGTTAKSTFTTTGSLNLAKNASISMGGASGFLTSVSSITANAFFGNGAGLSSVSGTDTSKVSKAGDTMTGTLTLTNAAISQTGAAGFLVNSSSITANAFFGNGAGLSNVSGTDTSKVSKAGDTITGGLTLNTAASFINTTSSITANAFFANGPYMGTTANAFVDIESSITASAYFSDGGQIDMTGGGANGFILTNSSVTANAFFGNGSPLTNLNASNVASGTLADARLTTNVNLLNTQQTITAPKTMSNSSFTLTGANGFLTSNSSVTANAFFSGSSTLGNNQLGIGTTTPSTDLNLIQSSNLAGMNEDHYSSDNVGSAILGRKARGTSSSPTAVQAGDRMMTYGGLGYDGTAFPSSGTARIVFVASNTQTASDHSSYIAFFDTPSGSTVPVERVRINSDGNVGIGTTLPAATLDVNGSVNSNSSVTANSFFTKYGVAYSSTPVMSFQGYNNGLGAGTTFQAFVPDSPITLIRAIVTVTVAGTGVNSSNFQCNNGANGSNINVSVPNASSPGTVITATGNVPVSAGVTVATLIQSTTGAGATPDVNMTCVYRMQ